MDEKIRILEMVKEGKITAEEAEKLLTAMGNTSSAGLSKNIGSGKASKVKGKLRIIVDSVDGEKVRIAIPLRLSRMVAGMIPSDALKDSNVDINAILENLGEGIEDMDEDIVNIDDGNGNTVRIYVEK